MHPNSFELWVIFIICETYFILEFYIVNSDLASTFQPLKLKPNDKSRESVKDPISVIYFSLKIDLAVD